MFFQILLASSVVLLLIILFFLLSRISSLAGQSASTDERIKRYEESTDRLLAEQRSQYETQIQRLEQRLEAQRIELQRSSSLEFQNLANEVLDRQSERLSDKNKMELTSILTPLKENIGEFRRAVDDSYMKESTSREALKRQIDALVNANAEIGKETRRLSDALRGNAQLQGRLGEQVLQRILDSMGFIQDIHYSTQASSAAGRKLTDEEGHTQRPDIIFYMPGDVKLVIDSKTSMTAYLAYCEAESEEDGKNAIRAHIASVKRHIDELAKAQYHKSIPGAIEHTLMFLPNDAAYIAALRGDSSLTDYAFRRNVVIVSPAHLLSIIQIINQLWRIDKQNRNAEEIAEIGGRLYDKFVTFLTDFESIHRNLEQSSKAFDKCRRHLSEGSVSIAARARKLRELGAKTTKTIPSEYVDQSKTDVNEEEI